MRTFCFIFARGGSKGIINKNIQKIGKYSLVEHSILMAKSINRQIDKIFVSSDSKDILSIADKLKVNKIIRPNNLSKDTSSEWLAWQHAVKTVYKEYGKFDTFLSLPATAPLRSKSDVLKCLTLFNKKMSQTVITYKQAHSNPWFNMILRNKKSHLSLVNGNKKKIFRRQQAPIVYDMTTVAYVSSPDFILNNHSIWDGTVDGVLIPKERAIDIDDSLDLLVAKNLYKNVKK